MTAMVLATATVGAFLFAGSPAVHADEPTPEPSVTAPTETPEEEPPVEIPVDPVIAEYNGRKINLAESWEGATSCTEMPSGEVHCYDSDEEVLTDPELPAETRKATIEGASDDASAAHPRRCVADYWCLYMDAKYEGKILRFSADGGKNLANYGCRDKLSSVYYWVNRWHINYGDARIIDKRSWPVNDRVRQLDAPAHVSRLSSLGYPNGGNWNDKTDIFDVRRA